MANVKNPKTSGSVSLIDGHIDPDKKEMTFEDVKMIRENPSAEDVVPVVRCKDCKWLYKPSLLCTHKRNRVFNTGIKRDFNCYCSYGERKYD